MWLGRGSDWSGGARAKANHICALLIPDDAREAGQAALEWHFDALPQRPAGRRDSAAARGRRDVYAERRSNAVVAAAPRTRVEASGRLPQAGRRFRTGAGPRVR